MKNPNPNDPRFASTAGQDGKQQQFFGGQPREMYLPTSPEDQDTFATALKYVEPDPVKRAAIMDVFGTAFKKQVDFVDDWNVTKSNVSRRFHQILSDIKFRGENDQAFISMLPDRFKPFVIGKDRRKEADDDDRDNPNTRPK